MARLRDIDFGGTDAESDNRLAEYFVQTAYVSEALRRAGPTIFLGRKGSGKSALFSQLPDLYESAGRRNILPIAITPDEYAWSALRGYREEGLSAEAAHTNAWKLTLALQAAAGLANWSHDWSPEASSAVTRLREFLKANFGTAAIEQNNAATKILTGLKSFNLSALGFGVGFDRRDRDEVRLTPQVTDALLREIRTVTEEVGVVALLDKLDDSWDGSDDSKTLLVGLLKAAKEINDDFGQLGDDDHGLKIITFLRSDIYGVLRFDDKDKHRALEQEITWSPAELEKMVLARLPDGVGLAAIFEEGDMRGASPFSYIAKRTFLRPREIIQFLKEGQRRSPAESEYITKDAIRDAENTYSRWKVDDLKQEFEKANPEFPRALECFRQEFNRYASPEEVENLVRRKQPKLVENVGGHEILETLFDASVIGVRLGDSGAARFKCEDSELTLPPKGSVYVHQSLHKGLNIRERRERRKSRAASATAEAPPDI